jgi:hypothetical protein
VVAPNSAITAIARAILSGDENSAGMAGDASAMPPWLADQRSYESTTMRAPRRVRRPTAAACAAASCTPALSLAAAARAPRALQPVPGTRGVAARGAQRGRTRSRCWTHTYMCNGHAARRAAASRARARACAPVARSTFRRGDGLQAAGGGERPRASTDGPTHRSRIRTASTRFGPSDRRSYSARTERSRVFPYADQFYPR